MKRFIIKLLLFLFICIGLDVFVGYASSSLQKSSKGGLTKKDEFIKNELNADIVIMGSSRASHHYVSNLMADSLGCTVYNAGMDGKGIIMNYGVLLEITRRYNPKIIIYELTPDFDWVNGDNEKYLAHLRHAYDIEGVDSIFWKVNPNERIKMMSKSYRSNSLVPHLIYDNILATKDSLNGYLPLWNVFEREKIRNGIAIEQSENVDNAIIDPVKVEYLLRMIYLCKIKNIELIFTISPVLLETKNRYKFGKELADKNDVMVIDYNELDYSFENDTLYQDKWHLNNNGATIYTLKIVEKLEKQ